jgi:peptide/nickel transport system permease protein
VSAVSKSELEVEVEQEFVAQHKGLGPGFWLAVGWLALVVVLAVLAPILPIADPSEIGNGDIGAGLLSGDNLLGTDVAGRDLLARTVYGARISLLIGFASVSFGMLIGGTLGIIAGYHRGKLESSLMGAMDVSLAFPAIVFAILLVTMLGRELGSILLAIGIISIAPICRLARANTLAFSQREFVTAARGLGAKDLRIMRRELLPNVVVPMMSLALLGVGLAIVAEGSLAFLGLSVQGDTLTWGNLIQEGASGNTLRTTPLSAFVPITALLLTVLSLNFVGDRLRSHFEVREAFGA